jgi:DNA processing protein
LKNKDLQNQIALTLIPNIGPVIAKKLIEHFDGEVAAIFKAKIKDLSVIENIGTTKAKCIKDFDDFKTAEKEIEFIEKFNIQTFFITDTLYPKRLLQMYDPPTILYYKGEADLNTTKTISIVGTRSNSDYGKKLTDKFVADIATINPLIISGLAFGIDTLAHKAAVKYNVATVGVLAHGLDKIYPPENTKLAKDMLAQGGGLLTEFISETKADRHNFPTRNRIVAALADATVVVETDVKGGSMITAELANGYNKDVFAFPGKTSDTKSAGCNKLIKTNKASLITDANDLIEQMNWQTKKKKAITQRQLFVELTMQEKLIVDALQQRENIHIDELCTITNLSNSQAASALLTLELQGIIQTLPGKMVGLV